MVFAKQIQKEANKVIHSILGDVRLGKQIQVERLQPVVAQITESILRNQGTLVSLCRIREGDTYTFQHSVSVATLLISFCRAMDLPAEIVHEAGVGGMLHDIGKMRVPDHILNKPCKLTDAEFTIMKNHVNLGLEVLHKTPDISETVLQIAGEHHETFGGVDPETDAAFGVAGRAHPGDARRNYRMSQVRRAMEPSCILTGSVSHSSVPLTRWTT